ncbi:VanZ family protein [Microbacterium ulmi]|uniref:VanZ family protein n=1 Tax=Microbacterium ulmi TaxID=179095 RepID=A0A7Y2M3B4_9MICO|nr:VanZ family protein [Microbacterium ulmi]NII70151.1 VanZ family protein [Microbacterium ulmi]NNH04308.1 VanZ family protein [Microbacterium ulmi]
MRGSAGDSTDTVRPNAIARLLRDPRAWLVVYAVVLAFIAFWPTPVDRDAKPFLAMITDAVPWLTYDVIEFTSNVLLFVPLGVLLALVLRGRWWLVVVIALVVAAAIEMGQWMLLPARTPSLADVIANVAGAVVGLGLVATVRSGTWRKK